MRSLTRPVACVCAAFLCGWLAAIASGQDVEQVPPPPPSQYKSSDIEYEHFFNHGNVKKIKDPSGAGGNGKLENEVIKSKVEVLGEVLKRRVQALRNVPGQKVELVFLVDSSASVGAENFFNELKFVKKLLADFTVSTEAARVAVVTFSSKNRVVRHIDHLTFATADKHKCHLLDQELPAIGYNSGGTYTLGALLEAQAVLGYARPDAVMAIFLVTDGYSNGGDPRPAAKRLREQGVEIFTFGIRNGNVKELFDMASEPQQEHSYIVDSFEEFEALARRALHEDLQTGSYLPQNMTSCDRLCKNQTDCCHTQAQCTCGTHTGHYACVCPPGHYGTGLKGDCHPCPGGTYRSEGGPGDLRSCKPCPDENHISEAGSTSVEQCRCQRGYVAEGTTCQLLACPKLEPPKNGYFLKNVCNSVFNGACGIRCNAGYKLVGSSIRLCQENGTWSGEETSCVMRSCGEIKPPKNGRMNCSQVDYVIDTECQFHCDSGYSLVGSRKRVCLPIGFWDGLPAFCKPVYCNPLPKLLNGTLTPASCSLAKSRFGEECNATCLEGFELKGPSVRRCQDNGSWSEEDNKGRCIDVTSPLITCPPNMTVTALDNENFANVTWDPPKSSDNSGHLPDIVSLPAVTELPMKFRIGTSSITYVAQDRRGNTAECTFHVTVLDMEPPTVDQCESPPTFLLRDRSVNVTWDEPIFSDNSAKLANVQRSHDPGVFPLGETEIVYTASDESGNNATCKIVVNVQEHACHMPVDPIHGQANCTQAPEAVYCSLTCYDGYAFALPPRQDYFCAYDGQWLPDVNPMPFPDCSVTTHSNTVIQDGVLRLDAEPKVCDDPFLMSSMEGQFKRRLAARLNEICGDNMICQVDDLQAECRQVMDEEGEVDWVNSNEIPRSKRSFKDSNETTSEQPIITIRPPRTRTLELRFKVRSRVPTGNITGPGLVETADGINVTMKELLFSEMNQVRTSLAKSALKGEFDVQFGGRSLNVRGVQFTSDNPQFFCSSGSVPQGEKCVLCPVGTYFNVVSETCESCTQGSYQPNEGQLSCLVCPGNTSTKVVNAKRPEECQAQCLAGTFSASGLEPCATCPVGTYQTEYFQRECLSCPEGSTTVRRGGRRIEDCRPLCPKGHVSETGLTPVCFPCPSGYYQPQAGQKFCIKCPKFMTTSTNGAGSKAECRLPGFLLDAGSGGDLLLNDAIDWTDEFEEPSILEVNECFSLPCHNGGQCQTLEFGFVCKCLPGFSGMQCETNIDECASLPCFNGGTCADAVNNFTCQCADGFTGHQCEININECLSDPCQNGATCMDRVLGYICSCPPGWNGSHCQTEVDECLSDPCQNGATCIDRLANFTCLCPTGWTGFLCEEAVDECLSEPCQNGGTCEDLIGSYYCHCPFGYDGINCQNDIDECAPSPCSYGATCVDRIGSFTCLCPPGVIGSTCNISVDSDFSLHFSSSGKLDYVVREGLREARLQRLTLCTWMNTADRDNYGTPFSYATDEEANALTLTDYSGFVLYINGHKKVTDVTANDGRWHLICITWDSKDGSWQIFADGEIRDQGTGLATDTSVSPNGTVILGQEQDSRGGDFSNAESYVGYLYGVELWNYVLDESTLTTMTTQCTGLKGNVLTWGDFKHGLRGGIRVEESTFCKGCSDPDPVDYGDVSSSTDEGQGTAHYSCHLGYELSIGSASRSCLVYGGWAGPEPQCRRVSCGYPGYILNGLVHGKSYSFGDTVTYNCTRGFKLVGNVSRTCDKNGAWTDEPPECQPMTCNPPTGFSDGTFEEQEYYAVGEKINFQCNSGFRLEGAVTLTCSDQGQWDDVIPVCQPLACSHPPVVSNGIMTNGIAEIPPEDIPAYLTPGSILTYTCSYGYQLKSTASIICGHDGLWMGEIPRCEAIDCGPPVEVPHSTVQRSADDDGVGTIVQYTCHEGYEYFGPAELECTEKGRWLDRNQRTSLPVCVPVDCGPVPSLENGEILAEDMTYASVAVVKCFRGYALIGPSNLTCTADRKWSQSDQIRCKPVTCSVEPQPIRNGRPASTLAAAYQYAQYVCDEGFRLSAVDSLQCQPDGTWQGEIPLCLPMECPRPGEIEGGSWKYSGGDVSDETIYYTGAEIIYSCDEGMQMEGEGRRVCDGSSGWTPRTPLPVCRKQHCPSLENPNRGSVAVEGFEPGQLANYECEQGYQISGPSERLCTDEGVWSDDEPICEEIVCQQPTEPSNGQVVYTSLTYGSKLLFQCNKGFVLEGAASKTCGDEGQWIGGKGRTLCVPRKCERPEIIEHGYISYDVAATGFVTGSSIVYDCEEGYEVIGIRERFCTASGDWTDQEPFCQLIHCDPVPSRLEHGTVIGNDTIYQSVIEFRCNPGYELMGAAQVSCESEKQWSAPFPVCKPRKCPHPGIVAHGAMTLKQMDNKQSSDAYHFGDVVTFSCLQGYSLSGSRERKCLQDGTWSQKAPSCNRITCPAAPIPVNGFTSRIIPNDLAFSNGSPDENDERVVGSGRTVKFGCKPGYLLRGSTLAKCLDSGQWDAVPPTCYPIKCTPPPKIKFGTHNSTMRREFSVGDEVEYFCDSGFRLKGDPITHCSVSGTWSAQSPSCQRAVCPSRYAIEDGTVTPFYPEDGSSRNVPMSLKFSCKSGYDLVGSAIVHCLGSGEWNNPFPTCVPWPCSTPPVPEHGQIESTAVDTEFISVTVKCDPGYRLRDNSVLTCGSKGEWFGKVECHPQLCPDPGAPPPYIRYVSQPSYRYGDQIHFNCPEGFVLNSTTSHMTCGADGQWDGKFGFCTLVRCPMLENPEFGTAKYSGGNSFRSRVTFACDEGFSLQGPKEASCLATGRWSVDPLLPACTALSCTDPDPVPNAEMVVRGTKVGDTVGYECHQGFHLNGDRERSCLPTGKWSGSDPACDPVFCSVPTSPENGYWEVGGFTAGSTIRFYCHPGFTLIGSPVITCLTDQEWNDQVPTCQQVTCSAPQKPDHGTVNIVKSDSAPIEEPESNAIHQQSSYAYRSVAHYNCDEGYQLFGPEKRLCTADGSWSEQSPHCQRIWCPELQPPPHGFVMGTGRQYGDRIRLSCMTGYRLLGAEESICQSSGTWSVADPQCQALTCDAPPLVVHSVVPDPAPEWLIGTQLTLQCRSGYTAVGDLSLTCLANQEWSLVKGKCQRVQCSRPVIKGAAVVRIGDSTSASFHAGDRVAISCNPGRRHRSGSAILTCQSDGVWSGQPPVCESACDGHCLNGGQCSSVPARRCTCPVGYSGDRCQHAHCILPCLYGGTCVAPYRCACRPGRGGLRCEKPICDPPCTNGGRCISPNTCQCPRGTFGPTCHKRSDNSKG